MAIGGCMKFNGLLVVLVAGMICLPFMSCGEDLSTLRQKTQQGDAAAQYRLGAAYAFGDGVPQDYKEAVNFWLLSARQGNAYAQYNLGVLYSQGQGVPQSYTEAVKYYRLAAEQGLAKAQYNLGAAYYNGKGVPKDPDKAAKWIRLAKEQESAQTQGARTAIQTPSTQSAVAPSEAPHASTVISACVIITFGIIIIWVLFNRTKIKVESNKPGENEKLPKERLDLPAINPVTPSKNSFSSSLKKGLTRAILFDSALNAFENLDDRQKQAVIENGAKLWLLARLNPEKTKKVKELLTGGKKQSAQERLDELKTLRENQLITAQEYEVKKAEIINLL